MAPSRVTQQGAMIGARPDHFSTKTFILTTFLSSFDHSPFTPTWHSVTEQYQKYLCNR
jgi:hypothetical protein